MHERTRRLLCQLIFVACCAVPTLATVSTIAIRRTSWFDDYRRARIEAELAERFGMHFAVGELKILAPGAMQLEQVRIADPETGSEVATIRVLQYSAGDNRIALRLAQPAVHSEHLAHAWRLLHDRFLCRPELTDLPIRIAADDLTIHSSRGGVTLTDMQAYVQPREDANETVTQFKIAGRDMELPATISITRDRSGLQPETAWKLNTGGTPLPCSILADLLPWLRNLGASCQFNGPISWRLRRDGWHVDLGGASLTGIEVSRLFDPLVHKLTGTADVWLGECRIDGGLISEIAGGITIERGQMGLSLLQSAEDLIGVRSLVETNRPTIAFDQLRLHFAMDHAGWRFAGACPTGPAGEVTGVLAIAQGHPLATLETSQPIAAGIPKQLVAPEYNQPLFASERPSSMLHLMPSPPAQTSYPMVPRVSMRERD